MKTRVDESIKIPRRDEWFAFPCIGRCTYKIVKILRSKIPATNFGYYTGVKLSSLLSSHKDKSKKINCGIYSISSSNFDRKYIGETEREINIRFQEHLKHFQKGNIKYSAVALHINKNPLHTIDPASALKLVEYEPRKFSENLKNPCISRNARRK